MKDVARFAKNLKGTGTSMWVILAWVFAGVGAGYAVCRLARAADAMLTLSKFLKQLGGVLALARLIDAILTVLSQGAFTRIPIVNRVAFALILALFTLRGILQALGTVLDDTDLVKDISEGLHTACHAVRGASEWLGEETMDLVDDLSDDASSVFDDALEAAKDVFD